MTKKIYAITAIVNDEIVEEKEAKGISKLWPTIKELFAHHPEANVVAKLNGEIDKDLVLEKKSSGKVWMVNRVKPVKAVKEKTIKERKERKPRKVKNTEETNTVEEVKHEEVSDEIVNETIGDFVEPETVADTSEIDDLLNGLDFKMAE